MSISVIQTAKYQPASTGNTIVFTLSSAPVAGNLLLAFTAYSQYGATRTCSAPDGTWTKLQDVTSGYDSLAVWVKTAGASEPTGYTFNISGSNEWRSGVIYEFSGVTQGYSSKSGTGNITDIPTLIGAYTLAASAYDSGSGSPTSGWTTDQSAVPSYHSCLAAHKDDLTTDVATPAGASWSPTPVVSAMIFLYPAEAEYPTPSLGGHSLGLVYNNPGVGNHSLAVVYSENPPGFGAHSLYILYSETEDIKRTFPLPPAERLLQSQSGKRIFPIVV